MILVMNEKFMNLVIGHREYMPSYDMYTIEAIGEDYEKAIPSLMIFTEPTDGKVLDELKKDLEEKDGEIEELKNKLKETEMNMEKRFRVQGEYNQIISDVRRGKIKLPEYEKELIEDWGSEVTTFTEKDWVEFEWGTEPFDTYKILERIRKKRRKK